MVKDKVTNVVYDIIKQMPDYAEEKSIESLRDIANRWDEITKEYVEERSLFESILSALTNDEVQEIVSIMQLGRGDFDTFQEALNHNKSYSKHREDAISYMIGKAPLKRYLRNGLRKIG